MFFVWGVKNTIGRTKCRDLLTVGSLYDVFVECSEGINITPLNLTSGGFVLKDEVGTKQTVSEQAYLVVGL
jgi:hypothetical protein